MPTPPPFRRLLVANRGEIAIRVMRACRELGIGTVAVFSDADADAPHVRYADAAVRIGPPPSRESYLLGEVILDAARRTGCEAVHPGYGFLSENAGFARLVEASGLVFVGPPADAMVVMGDKVGARRAMRAAGVPVVPGTDEPVSDDVAAIEVARGVGFPVMIKASAGGGGKGMRRVEGEAELPAALRAARSEARSAFGDDRVYVERCIDRPRHVEVQVFSDAFGRHMHVFERDCSVQRRHQKLIEESPCVALPEQTRTEMCRVAVRAAEAIGYRGAGTIEFLLAPDGKFYFLEMNTRLQVEHPVTELVTGVDLVHAQLLTAAGLPCGFTQDDLLQRGHAIEIRICAEDPSENFRPAPGRIERALLPSGPGVRFDGALYDGYEVPIHYDPLIAKLIVWGRDREQAIARLLRAVEETRLVGIKHNLPFFRAVLRHPPFLENRVDTGYIGRHLGHDLRLPTPTRSAVDAAAVAAMLALASRRAEPAGDVGDGADGSPWARAGRFARLRGA